MSTIGYIFKLPIKAAGLLAVKNAIPAKVLGAAGIAACAYNVAVDRSRHAKKDTKIDLANHYVDMYETNLSSSRDCSLLEKVKSYVTEQRLDTPFYPFVHGVKNYIADFASETMENIAPISLSVMALGAHGFFKKHGVGIDSKISSINSFLKNIHGKLQLPKAEMFGKATAAASAGLLLLGAAKIFLNDVWGVGKMEQ